MSGYKAKRFMGCLRKILNKTKTPNFTFLGVKLGVCFAIC